MAETAPGGRGPASSASRPELETIAPPAGGRPRRASRPEDAADLERFTRALAELEILGREELARFVEALPAGRRPADAADLAGELVRDGRLTKYQAAAIFQGKARGLTIGRYVVLEKLGAGGMGMVFKARDRKLGRVVAVKVLPPSASRTAESVLRFRREAEAAARLQHPNVVGALDIDEDRGAHFIVMEFAEGRDLARVVAERGPLSIGRAVACVLQAARGLAAVHALGVVHRDIKPANLLLDRDGTVKVLDLGLARIDGPADPSGADRPLTQTGTFMGTVDYMAPEQAVDSKTADHRSDIYSLGCTLHYLLTGRPPYPGDSLVERLLGHRERPIPSLAAARPEVPPALDALFRRMVAKDPARRPQAMAEVVAGLESCRATVRKVSASSGLMVFDESAPDAAGPAPTPAPSTLALSDLMIEVPSDLILPRRQSKPLAATPPRRGPLAGAIAAAVLAAVVGVAAARHRSKAAAAGPLAGPVRHEPAPAVAATTPPFQAKPTAAPAREPAQTPPLPIIIPLPAPPPAPTARPEPDDERPAPARPPMPEPLDPEPPFPPPPPPPPPFPPPFPPPRGGFPMPPPWW